MLNKSGLIVFCSYMFVCISQILLGIIALWELHSSGLGIVSALINSDLSHDLVPVYVILTTTLLENHEDAISVMLNYYDKSKLPM